jgi:HSP20 family molecular chaperone IbpA
MSIQRYQPTNTTLHDLYKLYNPFAYPYEYTEKMSRRLASMIDQSVSRSLDRYFNDQLFDIKLDDQGRYYQATAEIGNIDPQNLRVSFADGLLTVSGEKKIENTSPDGLSHTVRYESISKTISVPDTDKNVVAQAMNGRLMVMIPK